MEVAADAAASFYVMHKNKNIAEPFEYNAGRCYNSC